MIRWGARCNGNVIHSTSHHHSSTIFHIEPHFWHSTPYHISYHSTYLILPDHTSHGVMWIAWCGIWCDVECFAMPDVGCCVLFILMWLWYGTRCDVEYAWYGVMLHVPSCNVTEEVVKCGDAMWTNGVVHVVYGGVLWRKMWNVGELIPSDVEWFDAIIRHGGVMWYADGSNAVWDVVWFGMCTVG